MANIKSPIQLMLKRKGEGYTYQAMLGVSSHQNSTYKIYLSDPLGWWWFEGSLPRTIQRCPAPSRSYGRGLQSALIGTVTDIPEWLECNEERPAAAALFWAMRLCTVWKRPAKYTPEQLAEVEAKQLASYERARSVR